MGSTWMGPAQTVGRSSIRQWNNTEYRICSSYAYDAADRSKEHGIDFSMRLTRQPAIQLLKQVHDLMAVARAHVGCFCFLRGPHRRLVNTDKIDRHWLSSSRSLQDKVDRPAVNAKKRCLFDMVSRVSVRWSVIECPSQNVCVKRDHWCESKNGSESSNPINAHKGYSPVQINPGWVISSVRLRVPASTSTVSLMASTLKARSPVAKGETNSGSMGSGILYGDMNWVGHGTQYIFLGGGKE